VISRLEAIPHATLYFQLRLSSNRRTWTSVPRHWLGSLPIHWESVCASPSLVPRFSSTVSFPLSSCLVLPCLVQGAWRNWPSVPWPACCWNCVWVRWPCLAGSPSFS